MTGIAEDREVGDAAMELDGDLPHRQVPVDLLVIAGEAAVDGTEPFHACLVDTLHGTDPQLEVRVHRVLDEHGTVVAFQTVGELLHGKGVGGSAGTDPQDVDTILLAQLHMLRRGDLSSDEHTRLFLHFLQPGQRLLTVALEASGFGTGLPHTGAEHVAAFGGKLAGGGHYLLFGLGRAWAGYH